MALNKENAIFERESWITGRTQIEASFGANSDDFEIDGNNILNLKNKTSYISIHAAAFTPTTPDVADIVYSQDRVTVSTGAVGGTEFWASVNLPHNAIVTGVIVDGNSPSVAWTLKKIKRTDGTAVTMATANIDTEDTSITDATIDNSTYIYVIQTATIDTSEYIHGARITYTTDYD